MENRERNILDAATQVFLRYGVKRASMSDIANEAGVARQTLYNTYSNKDDILRGSIRMYGLDAMAAINAELPKATSVGEQFDLVMQEMVLKPFSFLHSSPNAQDLIDGYNAAGREEIEANYRSFQDVLERVFEPHGVRLESLELTPRALAEIVRTSAAALKHQGNDEKHLQNMIATLRALIVMAVEGR